MHHKLKLGMIGGGPGSMIGNIHRMAARLDNHFELVSGAFSRNIKKSHELNASLGLNPHRIYPCAEALIAAESNHTEVIAIVTPNADHYPYAALALKAGFHLIIDKPLTSNLKQAEELKDLAHHYQRHICLTLTFHGYPMIKELKHLMSHNKFGNLWKIEINFKQGWLSPAHIHNWRLHESSTTIADIGVHAFYLLEYLTSSPATVKNAHIEMLSGKNVDDDAVIFCEINGKIPALLRISQVVSGEDANLAVCVMGEKGSAHWEHKFPDQLLLKSHHQVKTILQAGNDCPYLATHTRESCRTPMGHPSGFIEAFANIYSQFALHLKGHKNSDFPDVNAGIRGVKFIDQALQFKKK